MKIESFSKIVKILFNSKWSAVITQYKVYNEVMKYMD
jgi:hypothetical protein